jgi:hypothetical protein
MPVNYFHFFDQREKGRNFNINLISILFIK